jgi:hypothetical protein
LFDEQSDHVHQHFLNSIELGHRSNRVSLIGLGIVHLENHVLIRFLLHDCVHLVPQTLHRVGSIITEFLADCGPHVLRDLSNLLLDVLVDFVFCKHDFVLDFFTALICVSLSMSINIGYLLQMSFQVTPVLS